MKTAVVLLALVACVLAQSPATNSYTTVTTGELYSSAITNTFTPASPYSPASPLSSGYTNSYTTVTTGELYSSAITNTFTPASPYSPASPLSSAYTNTYTPASPVSPASTGYSPASPVSPASTGYSPASPLTYSFSPVSSVGTVSLPPVSVFPNNADDDDDIDEVPYLSSFDVTQYDPIYSPSSSAVKPILTVAAVVVAVLVIA